jgi:DNA-binding MarR family transcriptional regulator
VSDAGAGRVQQLTELRYLVLAGQRVTNRMLGELLKPLRLTPAQAEVLRVLAEHGPLTLAGVGARLVCEPGSPSRIVSSLIRRGLVRRAVGVTDRRTVRLWLTEAGRAAEAGVVAVEQAMADRLAEVGTSAELEEVSALLRRLVAGTQHGDALAAREKPAERESQPC